MLGVLKILCCLFLATHDVLCVEYSPMKKSPIRVSDEDEFPSGSPTQLGWRNPENQRSFNVPDDEDWKGVLLDRSPPGPQFECGNRGLKLEINPVDFANIKIYDLLGNLLSLDQLTAFCGYFMKTSRTDVHLLFNYNSCYVKKEETTYALSISWYRTDRDISCPVPNRLPAVECKDKRMELTVGDIAPEELAVLFNGELAPLLHVADRCWQRRQSARGGPMFFIPYSACGVNFRDGQFILDLRFKYQRIPLSCSRLPSNDPNLSVAGQQLEQNKPVFPQNEFPTNIKMPNDPFPPAPKDDEPRPNPAPRPIPHFLSKRLPVPGLFDASINFPFSVPFPANPFSDKERMFGRGRDHLPKRPNFPGLFNLSVNFPFAVPIPVRPFPTKDRLPGQGRDQDQQMPGGQLPTVSDPDQLPNVNTDSDMDPLFGRRLPFFGSRDPDQQPSPGTVSLLSGDPSQQLPGSRHPLNRGGDKLGFVRYLFPLGRDPDQFPPSGSDPFFGGRDSLNRGGDEQFTGRRPLSKDRYPFSPGRDPDQQKFSKDLNQQKFSDDVPLFGASDPDQLLPESSDPSRRPLPERKNPLSSDHYPSALGRDRGQVLPGVRDQFSRGRDPDEPLGGRDPRFNHLQEKLAKISQLLPPGYFICPDDGQDPQSPQTLQSPSSPPYSNPDSPVTPGYPGDDQGSASYPDPKGQQFPSSPYQPDVSNGYGTKDTFFNPSSSDWYPKFVKQPDYSSQYQTPTANPPSDGKSSQSQYQPSLPVKLPFPPQHQNLNHFSSRGLLSPRSKPIVRSVKGSLMPLTEIRLLKDVPLP